MQPMTSAAVRGAAVKISISPSWGSAPGKKVNLKR